jgi:hypothetical protein
VAGEAVRFAAYDGAKAIAAAAAAMSTNYQTNNKQTITAFRVGEHGDNLARRRTKQIHAMQFRKTTKI